MNSFRLIIDGALSGARNMAIDQALHESAGNPGAGTTLRLYQWNPAVVSLGYFQTAEDFAVWKSGVQANASLTETQLDESELQVVRRVTGGGAIVHHHELTYSLSLPIADRWAMHHRELYDQMHLAILDALAEWGLQPVLWKEVAEGEKGSPGMDGKRFLCFRRRTIGDIELAGHKIGGSAQRRGISSLLQHGSILLARSVWAPQLPGIRELSGKDVAAGPLGTLLVDRFEKRFSMKALPGGLSEEESSLAIKWEHEKFGNSCWTDRR